MLSAKRIAPGQSGQIEVKVKTENLTDVKKSVTIISNDPRQPQISLLITATVQPEFELSERSIYFGSNPPGKEVVKELSLTIPAGRDVQLLGAETTDANVVVKLAPVAGSSGKRYKLVATQKPDAKEGYHFGIISIKTTSRLTPELKVPVRGMVSPGQRQ